MKNFLKKLTGLDKVEAAQAHIDAEKMELLKQKDPKEYATRRKEAWVNVLDMKVNKDNIRNGFFELDWNKYFIQELIQAGYGVDNDPDEEIFDRWFRDIVYGMLDEEGIDATDRSAGYINVVPIAKGKSEVS